MRKPRMVQPGFSGRNEAGTAAGRHNPEIRTAPDVMLPALSLSRVTTLLLLFAALTLAASQLAFRYSLSAGMAELESTGRHRLDLYAASLEREIDKYGYFPALLGLDQSVLDLLAAPDATRVARMNHYLEQLNARAGSLSIYILDREGRVVASSNWRQRDSFIGENLFFRPYFRQALETGAGRFFGIGTTQAGRLAFTLAAAMGALCGVLIAPLTTVYYDSGFLIGLKGFVGAIIGGLASYPVAALGALLVGLLESYSSFWASAFKEVIVFTLIIPVLVLRSLAAPEVEEEKD